MTGTEKDKNEDDEGDIPFVPDFGIKQPDGLHHQAFTDTERGAQLEQGPEDR